MARLRVLIIDSNIENSAVIAKLVRGIGHISVKVQNQEQALELLSIDKFDYFILNLVLPIFKEDEADFENGLGLIDQIRDYYPRFLEYPIIVFTEQLIDYERLGDCMEAGANRFLPFKSNVSEDRIKLARTVRILTDKALAKRNSKTNAFGSLTEINTDLILKKIASKYKLFVDLKAMEVFFKGIRLPSGRDGLQQRHKVFLFILGRNPGKTMSSDRVQEKIEKYRLDKFDDPDKNIRAQIRNAFRKLAKKYPGKITETDIKGFLKTDRTDGTRLNLDQDEIFTIYGDEEYPQL